jgi:hypothetical protein
MPTELLASRLVLRAAVCFSIAGVLGLWMIRRKASGRLLAVQGPLVVFQLIALIPMIGLGDRERQLPIREVATTVLDRQNQNEPLAMVGIMKPSLHFYADQVVVYEGISKRALINVTERFRKEERRGWKGVPVDKKGGSQTAIIVIDSYTLKKEHWKGLNPVKLGQFGVYQILRFDRNKLKKRASELQSEGVSSTWELPRPERY